MRTVFIVALAAWAALGGACTEAKRPEISVGAAAPAVAITHVHFGGVPGSRTGPELEVAVWPDGRIVWDADSGAPGTDLREARIDPRKVLDLLERMRDDRVFEAGAFRCSWFGPDSDYLVIQLVSGSDRARLSSWHEGFETNPKLAVVNGVAIALGNEPREAVMASATPEWLEFLQVWRDIRGTVAGWIPAGGEPFSGRIDLKELW